MVQSIRRLLLVAASMMAIVMVSGTALAENQVLGGLLGGGAGALVGNSIGGRDGAILGGAVGAAAGVAIAGNYRSAPRYYAREPVYYYAQPTVIYSAPPVYYQRYEVERGRHHRHGYDYDRHDRYDRYDRNRGSSRHDRRH